MPKIPIELVNGSALDSVDSVVSVNNFNLYPEVNINSSKRSVKSFPNVSKDVTVVTGSKFVNSIALTPNTASDVYTFTFRSAAGTGTIDIYQGSTLKASHSIFGMNTNTGGFNIATNGINIVGVSTDPTKITPWDFVYDIAGATVQSITVADPTYIGFGEAVDVEYADGRYFFTTQSAIFHGDLKTDAGQGVNFNAASFATLPFVDSLGRGLQSVGGSMYVFSDSKCVLYRNVGTTPFTLQQVTGVELDVGLTKGTTKVSVGNVIYLHGAAEGKRRSIYSISGTSVTELVANNDDLTSPIIVDSVSINGNQLIIFNPVLNDSGSDNFTACYNATTGQVFFNPTLITGTGEKTNTFPFLKFHQGNGNNLFGVIAETDGAGAQDTYIGSLNESQSASSSYNYGPGIQIVFQYEFSFLQNSGDPVKISSIEFSFAGVATAELESSVDGETFTSLGTFDLSSFSDGKKVAEWRRINRYFSQVMFRLTLTADSDARIAILSGGLNT